MKMNASPGLLLGLGAASVALLGLWWVGRVGAGKAASSAAAGIVSAAGGAVSGAVGAVGAGVGLPTPEQTVTDPAQARWIIDRAGYWEASKWCGVPALLQGAAMDSGTGTPPPPGSPAGVAFGLAGGYIDYGTGSGW